MIARRRHHPDGDDAGEDDAADPDELAGEPSGAGAVAGLETGDEGGHEDGREHPAGEELEQHVRDEVGRLVRVAERRRPEGGAHGEHAGEPGEAGDEVPRRDPGRGATEGGPVRVGVGVGPGDRDWRSHPGASPDLERRRQERLRALADAVVAELAAGAVLATPAPWRRARGTPRGRRRSTPDRRGPRRSGSGRRTRRARRRDRRRRAVPGRRPGPAGRRRRPARARPRWRRRSPGRGSAP